MIFRDIPFSEICLTLWTSKPWSLYLQHFMKTEHYICFPYNAPPMCSHSSAMIHLLVAPVKAFPCISARRSPAPVVTAAPQGIIKEQFRSIWLYYVPLAGQRTRDGAPASQHTGHGNGCISASNCVSNGNFMQSTNKMYFYNWSHKSLNVIGISKQSHLMYANFFHSKMAG